VPTVALFLLTTSLAFTQCATQLGTLNSPNFQKDGSVFVCFEDTFKVELSNYQLMEGQKLYYVYHFDKDYTLGYFKIDTAETEGMINSYPDEIFVTAIITNSNSLFEIDDSCAVFSNTIEVNFLERIQVEVDYSCYISYSVEYADIKYVLEGGLPEIDSSYSYQLIGDLIDTLAYNRINSITVDIETTNGAIF